MGNHPAATSALVAVSLNTLISLAKKVASLRLHRHKNKASLSGGYASRFKGRGMEFDESRMYQPGDDIRSIDWRVTARSDKTHTKIYREERERPVTLAVDYRATMSFATRGVFKSVQAANIAGLLAWAALKNGDRIGGFIFNDSGYQALKAKGGKHAVLQFLNALVKPRYVTQAAGSLEKSLAHLAHHVVSGSVVYIISDFRGMNDKVELHLAKIVRHCSVVLVHVYDPIEQQFPDKGRYRLTDDVTDKTIDTRDKKSLLAYQQHFAQRQDDLQQLCNKWRMTLVNCQTTDDPTAVLR